MWQAGCVFYLYWTLNVNEQVYKTTDQYYVEVYACRSKHGSIWLKKKYMLMKKIFYIIFAEQYCICNRFFSFLKRSMCHFLSWEVSDLFVRKCLNILFHEVINKAPWEICYLSNPSLLLFSTSLQEIFKLCFCWKSSPLPLHLDSSTRSHVYTYISCYVYSPIQQQNMFFFCPKYISNIC